MGRGSIFFSKAKGKIGNVVLANVNGQEVQRAYNGEPANPRTASQMYQRGLFADVVKFFTRGQQNFFKFAFEGKKKTESDYNAFVRANMKYGCYLNKNVIDDPTRPKIGAFIMTQGSIPSAPFEYSEQGSVFGVSFVNNHVGVTPYDTVGDMSDLLREWNPAIQEGDIVTFLTISSGYVLDEEYLLFSYMSPAVAGVLEPKWNIKQFIVSSADTTSLVDLGIQGYADSNVVGMYDTDAPQAPLDNLICGSCLCISRNTKSGLKVMTSQLQLSYGARAVWYRTNPNSGYLSQQYRDVYLKSWGTSEEVILQGSLAHKVVEVVVPALTAFSDDYNSFTSALYSTTYHPVPFASDPLEVNSKVFFAVSGSNLAALAASDFTISDEGPTLDKITVVSDSLIIIEVSTGSAVATGVTVNYRSVSIFTFDVED